MTPTQRGELQKPSAEVRRKETEIRFRIALSNQSKQVYTFNSLDNLGNHVATSIFTKCSPVFSHKLHISAIYLNPKSKIDGGI